MITTIQVRTPYNHLTTWRVHISGKLSTSILIWPWTMKPLCYVIFYILMLPIFFTYYVSFILSSQEKISNTHVTLLCSSCMHGWYVMKCELYYSWLVGDCCWKLVVVGRLTAVQSSHDERWWRHQPASTLPHAPHQCFPVTSIFRHKLSSWCETLTDSN